MGMIIRTAFNNQEWKRQCNNADRDRRLFQCKDKVVNTGYKINKEGVCQSDCWESGLCKNYKWTCLTGNFSRKAKGPVFFIYRDIDGSLVLWGRSIVKNVEDNIVYFKQFKPIISSKRIQNLTYEYFESLGIPEWKSGTFRYITDDIAESLDQLIDGEEDLFTDPAELFSDKEGKKILRRHLITERSARLVKNFKSTLKDYGCAVCGFDFNEKYGELGREFIEAHHTKPLASIKKATKVSVKDLVAVCSNCHRMLHKTNPPITVSNLSKLLK